MLSGEDKQAFWNAVMFYTRIPVPKNTLYSEKLLNQSRKYFTAVGLIIGAIACLSYLVATAFLPNSVAVLISMICSVLATGAFHEDGLADSCDALGGGWTPEQVLTIMKDSRIGTYGTVGLISVLALKYALLINLAEFGALVWCLCVLSGHTTSRLHSSRQIKHYDYVQDIDKSKVKPITSTPLSREDELFSLIVALIPCTLLTFYSLTAAVAGLVLGYFVANRFMVYCNTRIGGYTGDILGAIQQISEITFLICCLAVFSTSQ